MKKLASILLSLTLLFTLTVPALAAGTGEFDFDILVDGESSASVEVGDTITVSLVLSSTDGVAYDLYNMQDYIRFDTTYLEFVDDSISVYQVPVEIPYSLFSASGSESYVFANRTPNTAYAIGAGEEIQVVSFQLEAVKTGSTSITHMNIEMLTQDNVNQTVNASTATVTIASGDTGSSDTGDSGSSDSGSSDSGSSGSTSSGSNSSGGGGSSSSSSDDAYEVDVDTPTSSDTTATLEAAGTVSDGTLTADLDTDHIEYAIEMALDEADSSDDVTVVVNITSDDDFDGFSLNLPLDVQEIILDNDVNFFILATDSVEISIDYDAIYTINNLADNDVQITVTPVEVDADIVGDRPAYSFNISNDDVTVSDFDGGTIKIGIPYTLATDETAGDILVVYIDEDGNVTKVAGSYYDSDTGLAMATVSHFSTFAVGYDENWSTYFSDVGESSYCYDAVYWAVANGITTGYADGTFGPNTTCTRAQAVTFLYRAAGEPAVSVETSFTDLVEGSYYYDAVLWAVENGITTGLDDTTFAPNNTCTRGQIVTFLYRMEGEPAVSGEGMIDVGEGSYCYNAVLWAVANGITTGYEDGTFGPNDLCTRGQIVTFLYRYLG